MTDHFSNLNYKDEDTERLINGYFEKKRQQEREEKERLEREAQERINKKKKGKNLEKKVKPIQNPIINPINPVNFIPSDYIHFEQPYSFDIAISEDFGSCKGKDWYNQNKELLSNGYLMSNVLEGMTLFQNIVESYKDNKKVLFDSAGNSIKKGIIDDLYKFLTSDYNIGSWYNMNALFENRNGIWIMKEAINYDKPKDELIFQEKQIIVPITKDCYVNFNNLTAEGFPKEKHSNKTYAQGENIHYWYPRNGCVARFLADSVRANLDCDWDPSNTDSSLGVHAVRHEVKKSTGGSK